MNEETRAKIIKWIFDNHEHHDYKDDTCDEMVCSQMPYVDSLALEEFIKDLK